MNFSQISLEFHENLSRISASRRWSVNKGKMFVVLFITMIGQMLLSCLQELWSIRNHFWFLWWRMYWRPHSVISSLQHFELHDVPGNEWILWSLDEPYNSDRTNIPTHASASWNLSSLWVVIEDVTYSQMLRASMYSALKPWFWWCINSTPFVRRDNKKNLSITLAVGDRNDIWTIRSRPHQWACRFCGFFWLFKRYFSYK